MHQDCVFSLHTVTRARLAAQSQCCGTALTDFAASADIVSQARVNAFFALERNYHSFYMLCSGIEMKRLEGSLYSNLST